MKSQSIYERVAKSNINKNLRHQKEFCNTYGLDVEYEHGYFRRMFRWVTMGETLYAVTPKRRGSQTD